MPPDFCTEVLVKCEVTSDLPYFRPEDNMVSSTAQCSVHSGGIEVHSRIQPGCPKNLKIHNFCVFHGGILIQRNSFVFIMCLRIDRNHFHRQAPHRKTNFKDTPLKHQ